MISTTTNARLNINVITVTPVTGVKTINMTAYTKASRELKEEAMTSLLTELRNVTAIPAQVVISVAQDIQYYFVPQTLTNQLGYFYGVGSEIIIDGISFKRDKAEKTYRYTYTKGHEGLTEHAKRYFGNEFDLEGLQQYNNFVASTIQANNKKIWSHAEDFFRKVSTAPFNKAVVMQPNKKVYLETHKEQYVERQLKELIPATGKIDFNQMMLTPEQQTYLDARRTAYGLDNDYFEYMEVNIKTEHGYAQGIPQVYLSQRVRSIKSSYAGGDNSEETPMNGQANVSIYSQQQYFAQKAYMNYVMLKQYEKLGVMDEDYVICPVCKMPTRKTHAFCDVCHEIRPDVQSEVESKVNEYCISLAEHLPKYMDSEMYAKIFNFALEELGYTDNQSEDISFDILKSK